MANLTTSQQIRKAKNRGLNMVELAQMKAIARKETEKMEVQATEKAFVLMLGIPLILLKEDYWQKSFNKRGKQFIEDCYSLFDSVQQGVVTYKELIDQISELGIDIEAEWLEAKNG